MCHCQGSRDRLNDHLDPRILDALNASLGDFHIWRATPILRDFGDPYSTRKGHDFLRERMGRTAIHRAAVLGLPRGPRSAKP